MTDKRYIISDASKMLNVEAHVLRYWEEELDIKVPRNEMGHRYYTDNHIEVLKKVKELKECGYGLKAIKMVINANGEENNKLIIRETSQIKAESKMEQFQAMMNEIVTNALREVGKEWGESISGNVSSSVIKEMDYLLRMKEEREEERFKKVDELIRNKQKAKKEVAITSEKRKFFSRKKENAQKRK